MRHVAHHVTSMEKTDGPSGGTGYQAIETLTSPIMNKSISLISLCVALGTTMTIGADLFDAPGPGYREQIGVERGGTMERLNLLDDRHARPSRPGATEELFLKLHPNLKRERNEWESARDEARQKAEMSRFVDKDRLPEYPSREFSAKLSQFQSECQRLTGLLPELPSDNTFSVPLRLFAPPSAQPSGPVSVNPWRK